MAFRVFWSPTAERQFEKIVRDAADVASVTASARVIDRYLVAEPQTFGESRFGTSRIAFVHPLGALYEVHEDDDTVIVYGVWSIDRT